MFTSLNASKPSKLSSSAIFLTAGSNALGKEDPAYPGAQRFLITRSSPRFKPGVWYSVHIRQVGRVITVWDGRTKLGAFWDRQRAYLSGSLGLYCEDSRVAYDNVRVVQA